MFLAVLFGDRMSLPGADGAEEDGKEGVGETTPLLVSPSETLCGAAAGFGTVRVGGKGREREVGLEVSFLEDEDSWGEVEDSSLGSSPE